MTLGIAWSYLTQEQKSNFKGQAHAILWKLHSIQPPRGSTRSFVVPDPDPVGNGRIREEEHSITFLEHEDDPDLGFMHNDATRSNLIVQDGRITAVIDWEMAGFFGWAAAAAVHTRVRRSIDKNNIEKLNWPAHVVKDFLFWDDVYEPVEGQ